MDNDHPTFFDEILGTASFPNPNESKTTILDQISAVAGDAISMLEQHQQQQQQQQQDDAVTEYDDDDDDDDDDDPLSLSPSMIQSSLTLSSDSAHKDPIRKDDDNDSDSIIEEGILIAEAAAAAGNNDFGDYSSSSSSSPSSSSSCYDEGKTIASSNHGYFDRVGLATPVAYTSFEDSIKSDDTNNNSHESDKNQEVPKSHHHHHLLRRCHSETSLNSYSPLDDQQSLYSTDSAISPDSFMNIGKHLFQSSDGVVVSRRNSFSSVSSCAPSVMNQHLPSTTTTVVTRRRSVPPSTTTTTRTRGGVWWWDGFKDDDFEVMRDIVNVIDLDDDDDNFCNRRRMMMVGPPPPPLPPSHPVLDDNDNDSHEEEEEEEDVSTVLKMIPPQFICPICQDVAVGCVISNCSCVDKKEVVYCQSCIESNVSTTTRVDHHDEDYVVIANHDDDDDDDSEAKKLKVTPCQKCHDIKTTPCHALDIAALNIISNLHSSTPDHILSSFQSKYYRRLDSWKQEVIERRLKYQERKKEWMLAELIRREEELLWDEGQMVEKQRRRIREVVVGWRTGLMVVTAATLATLLGGRIGGRR